MKKKFEETNYWQSYSDMMAALLLIFILVIAVALVQLKEQQRELKLQKTELLAKQEELARQSMELDEQQTRLYEQQTRLDEQHIQLEEKKKLLEEQGEAHLKLKEQYLKAQEQLDRIIGIKKEIIEALNQEFQKENLSIELDSKTGAIRFQSEILFDTAKSDLLPAGKEYLDAFLGVYFRILLSSDYKEYISEIIIEGNCDSRGTYEDNLVLSQDRARSVALYARELLEKELNAEEMEELLKLLNINGRSNKNLIYDSNNQEDLDASRRVELKFRLKDEEMIEEMISIMGGEQ